MSKKDFFRILIKVFGLYSVINILFSFVPGTVSYIFYDNWWLGVFYLALQIAVAVLFFTFLIQKPDVVINLLKLDKGFDDEQILVEKLSSTHFFKLALLIIGGLLLIQYIPALITNTVLVFKENVAHEDSGSQLSINLAISFINVAIGYLLVTNHDKVSSFMKEKNEQ